MISEFRRSFSVGDHTDVSKAVALALVHFGCGTDKHSALMSQYGTWVKPDFTLEYRGHRIPVSVDDTAGTLEFRVQAYVGSRIP